MNVIVKVGVRGPIARRHDSNTLLKGHGEIWQYMGRYGSIWQMKTIYGGIQVWERECGGSYKGWIRSGIGIGAS